MQFSVYPSFYICHPCSLPPYLTWAQIDNSNYFLLKYGDKCNIQALTLLYFSSYIQVQVNVAAARELSQGQINEQLKLKIYWNLYRITHGQYVFKKVEHCLCAEIINWILRDNKICLCGCLYECQLVCS